MNGTISQCRWTAAPWLIEKLIKNYSNCVRIYIMSPVPLSKNYPDDETTAPLLENTWKKWLTQNKCYPPAFIVFWWPIIQTLKMNMVVGVYSLFSTCGIFCFACPALFCPISTMYASLCSDHYISLWANPFCLSVHWSTFFVSSSLGFPSWFDLILWEWFSPPGPSCLLHLAPVFLVVCSLSVIPSV